MERIPCANQDSCHLRDTSRGCFEDVHHLFYPRKDYRTSTERQFRELDENKVRVCRAVHDNEHALWLIPDKPDLEIMRMAITEERNRRLTPEGPEAA
jgi:hypothetical protein